MKATNIIFSIIFSLAIAVPAMAQHNDHKATPAANSQATVSDSFKVWGNCDMCKKKIETSASKVSGVKSASWDKKTKMLTVSYSGTSKRSEVQQAIAKAGYDTQDVKAAEEAYQNLPSCCKYERKK